jgi:nicotinamidase/pyrazinamidase
MKIGKSTDVLLVVDVQNDFINGSLAVRDALGIVPVVNEYIAKSNICVFSKDMHLAKHSSFVEQGGPWPPHCVIGTKGADLHSKLDIDMRSVTIISKGLEIDKDAYSAFDGTALGRLLLGLSTKRLFVCGLATDYCVKATVMDALEIKGLEVYLLADAIEAVNVHNGDGDEAIKDMIEAGAILITLEDVE